MEHNGLEYGILGDAALPNEMLQAVAAEQWRAREVALSDTGRNGFHMRRFNKSFPLIFSASGITNWLSLVTYSIRGTGGGFSVPGMTN